MAFTTAEEIRVAALETAVTAAQKQLTAIEAALLKIDFSVRETYNTVKAA